MLDAYARKLLGELLATVRTLLAVTLRDPVLGALGVRCFGRFGERCAGTLGFDDLDEIVEGNPELIGVELLTLRPAAA